MSVYAYWKLTEDQGQMYYTMTIPGGYHHGFYHRRNGLFPWANQ